MKLIKLILQNSNQIWTYHVSGIQMTNALGLRLFVTFRPSYSVMENEFLVFTATCFSNVAVMGSLDVRLSVRSVGDSWSHTSS